MNSNLFHNIANGLILLMSALTAALLSSGCTTLANGSLECSSSWLSSWVGPGAMAVMVAALTALKLTVNVVRDGVGGLAKQQPPVQ